MTTNTPTPDVAATIRAAERLAYWYGEMDRRGIGQGDAAATQVFESKAALEAAARDACYAYALAVVQGLGCDLALSPGVPDCARYGTCGTCKAIDDLQALRDAQAARA